MNSLGRLFAEASGKHPLETLGGLVCCWVLLCLVWRCVVAAVLERPARFQIRDREDRR